MPAVEKEWEKCPKKSSQSFIRKLHMKIYFTHNNNNKLYNKKKQERKRKRRGGKKGGNDTGEERGSAVAGVALIQPTKCPESWGVPHGLCGSNFP